MSDDPIYDSMKRQEFRREPIDQRAEAAEARAKAAEDRIIELKAENTRVLGSHDAYAARYEDELLDRKSAEALAVDHENQIAELCLGLDQAEGRVAELVTEIEAAKRFGGGFYGEQVDEGTRDVYRASARQALDRLDGKEPTP